MLIYTDELIVGPWAADYMIYEQHLNVFFSICNQPV